MIPVKFGLNTIHFYIILKHRVLRKFLDISLNTIHFYIILKPQIQKCSASYALIV